MDWRPLASKMVVLIADAPPHGIGEYGDGMYRHHRFTATQFCTQFASYLGFDSGSPDGNDPLQIAREMAKHGITLVGPNFPIATNATDRVRSFLLHVSQRSAATL